MPGRPVSRCESALHFEWRQATEINLPPDELAIIEGLVSAGRFATVEEAVAEGIRLLASSEQLRRQVQEGINQADDGDVSDHDTVFARLRAMAGAVQTDGGQ